MLLTYIKQHLSNIWNSIHEKVKQHWGYAEATALLIVPCPFLEKEKKS